MSLTEPLDEPGSPGPAPTQERSPRLPASQIGSLETAADDALHRYQSP